MELTLSIRRQEETRNWKTLHELYSEYVDFYLYKANGKCSCEHILYSIPQDYYYINYGSASTEENHIHISTNNLWNCSKIARLKRRYIEFSASYSNV